MNLMSNDVGRFDLGFLFLAYTFLAPIQALMFMYFLWVEIGVGTMGGATVILVIIPLQGIKYLGVGFLKKIRLILTKIFSNRLPYCSSFEWNLDHKIS